MENNVVFPSKEIWESYAPLKTCFFAWEVVWEGDHNCSYFNEEGMVNG